MGFPTGMAASPAVLLLTVFVFLISSMPSPPQASSPQPRAASENLPLSSLVDEEVSNRQSGRTEAGGRALAAFGLGVSESARQVPTGSNPLHHNHDPITKPKQEVHAVIASHP